MTAASSDVYAAILADQQLYLAEQRARRQQQQQQRRPPPPPPPPPPRTPPPPTDKTGMPLEWEPQFDGVGLDLPEELRDIESPPPVMTRDQLAAAAITARLLIEDVVHRGQGALPALGHDGSGRFRCSVTRMIKVREPHWLGAQGPESAGTPDLAVRSTLIHFLTHTHTHTHKQSLSHSHSRSHLMPSNLHPAPRQRDRGLDTYQKVVLLRMWGFLSGHVHHVPWGASQQDLGRVMALIQQTTRWLELHLGHLVPGMETVASEQRVAAHHFSTGAASNGTGQIPGSGLCPTPSQHGTTPCHLY
jgi:hypothetical protein